MHKEWKRKLEREIADVFDKGLTMQNVEMAGELVDMWKDIHEVCYWECKEEHMEKLDELAEHEVKTHKMHHENPGTYDASPMTMRNGAKKK